MYGSIALSAKSAHDYRSVVGEEAVAELRELARPLQQARVLNLSVTAFATRTAELLRSMVPLMNDLGLDCSWQVVRTAAEFQAMSQNMYWALGGLPTPWTKKMTQLWRQFADMNAALFDQD